MDRSDVTLERMRSFVRVAERGSLSAVARELGIGQSTITRHLRELEEAVGVPLLSRTTRRVTMTDEGSRYYADSVQILRLVEQAGDEARSTRGAPAGTIRISCTAAIGVLHVSRLIFAFQDRYPDIGVDLSLTDERDRPCAGGRRYRASPGAAHRQLHEAAGPRPEPAPAGGRARLSGGARQADRPAGSGRP